MNANECFQAGKLQEAIDAQSAEVKARPADRGQRLFLFELLTFAGDLERAFKQINAVAYGDLEVDAAVAEYRQLLDAEKDRRRLFSEGAAPHFFGAPPEHCRLRLEAVNCLRAQQPAEAAKLLRRANELAPAFRGTLNGKAFEVLRDEDDLFGPIVEVMNKGAYYWVPLEEVSAVTMKAPKAPRDLLWVRTGLEMKEGSEGSVFLPTLYPGSHESADECVKLGRLTDWKELDDDLVMGLGMHSFQVDDDQAGLLEWRTLKIT